ncbi:MAG TPA: ribosome silencing factor [Bacteroidales bacterium]|nr:ribosome silencing factor [Bacteroidales bacterium]HQQ11826.1 ribosome silencing factor [Bacteroidales bacterium]
MRKRHQIENTPEVLKTIIQTIQDKKGSDIISLNLKKIHAAVTDYFVICHAPSRTQVDAIAGHIVDEVSIKCGQRPYNKEGFENAEWILIDYVDVVVHVFLDSTRNFYQLERLWADAEKTVYDDEAK